MSKAGYLVAVVLFFALAAKAGSTCPVTLVNGAGESNAFSITFRNAGKLLIRRLGIQLQPGPSQSASISKPIIELHTTKKRRAGWPGVTVTVYFSLPCSP